MPVILFVYLQVAFVALLLDGRLTRTVKRTVRQICAATSPPLVMQWDCLRRLSTDFVAGRLQLDDLTRMAFDLVKREGAGGDAAVSWSTRCAEAEDGCLHFLSCL